MIIKIQDKPYNFKYKFDEITLNDYLEIVDILNEDQYDYFTSQETKKQVRRKEPRPKDERDADFIFDTYRKVISRLSTIPVKYLNEDEVVNTLLQHIAPIFEHISAINDSIDADDETYPTFTIDGDELSFTNIGEWSFYKWVTLETFTSKGLSEKVVNEEGEEVIKQIIKGNRYILPLLYGEFDESLNDLDRKLEYFNNEASFTTTYPVFVRLLTAINNVKKIHSFIYNSESMNTNSSPNVDKHCQDFGWVSTLVDIAEKGVFGTYNEVKNANLIQVLEYLNCSCSKNAAEANDSNLKHNK